MPNEFYAPYNFVPATGKVGKGPTPTKTWDNEHEIHNEAPQTRHDKWDSENKSGRIVCKVTLQTPTVVGADQSGGDDNTNTSATVTPYKVDDKPALPANSLRGMISSISEQLSQSALRVLDNQLLSVRKPVKESITAIGLLKEFDGVLKLAPMAVGVVSKDESGNFALKDQEKKIFEGQNWNQILPVLLNGYTTEKGRALDRKKGKRNVPNHKSASSGSFLSDTNLESFHSSRVKIYWAKLAAPSTSIQQSIPENTKGLEVRKGRLIGQKFKDGFIQPITTAEYDDLSAQEKAEYSKGFLFIFGIEGRDVPDTKKHEYFIPVSNYENINILESALTNYSRLAKQAANRNEDPALPFLPKGYTDIELTAGHLVRFSVDEQGLVNEISWSAIWRKLVNAKQSEFFEKISPNLVPWNMERKQLTPAELIFGVVEDRDNATEQEKKAHLARHLASRVRFSDGICEGTVKQDGEVTLKILSSPKLPAPSMYFTTGNDNRPIAKTELTKQKHIPRGRKVYLHHHQDQAQTKNVPIQHWQTSKPNEHANQKLSVNPISKGTEFWFHIDFNNLTNDELSLLLASLTPDKNFLHRLGLGKPLGLGSVKVETAGTFLIERKKRYQDMLSLSETTARYQSYITGELTAPSLPDRYQAESTALTELSPADFHLSSKLIDEQTREILATVGDPNNLKSDVSVSYHLAQGQTEEKEGFQWFVNNEKEDSHKQQSLGIVKSGLLLPTLRKN